MAKRNSEPFKKRAVTASERRAIASRYGCHPGGSVVASCIYCSRAGSINWVPQDRGLGWVQFVDLEIEHKFPELQGGGGGDNLDIACRPCNRAKGGRTEQQWRDAQRTSSKCANNTGASDATNS